MIRAMSAKDRGEGGGGKKKGGRTAAAKEKQYAYTLAFHGRLDAAFQARRLNAHQACEALGMYDSRFTKWKEGKGYVHADEALRLAAWLDVPVDWLVDVENREPVPPSRREWRAREQERLEEERAGETAAERQLRQLIAGSIGYQEAMRIILAHLYSEARGGPPPAGAETKPPPPGNPGGGGKVPSMRGKKFPPEK